MPVLSAQKVASGLARPVFATSPPGDPGRLFIVEQHTGKIRIFRTGTGALDPNPFLQVSGLAQANEQGLLGLAFAPDYAQSGLFYVTFTDTANVMTVRRYHVSSANPDAADPASATTVLTVQEQFTNHKGGWTAFGPRDGLLYVGLGDGGSEGDPNNTSQDLGLLLGKMLRIDVGRDDFPGDPGRNYGIPPDNPFVGRAGARPEIWAWGLRNPWRCSFDRRTGDLYIGDVGQNQIEEIDFQPATSRGGENYGWSLKEGSRPFKPALIHGQVLTDPILEYAHDDPVEGGSAVVGGYVYRGGAIAGLAGTYFYADITGPVRSFRFDPATRAVTEKIDRTAELFLAGGPAAVSSFGEDGAGELYVVNLIPGEVYRIGPAA